MISKFTFLCLAPLVVFSTDLPIPDSWTQNHEPETTLDVIGTLDAAYRSSNISESARLLKEHSKTLISTKDGVALGLKASVLTNDYLLFQKFISTQESSLKPDQQTINLALYVAASENRPLYTPALFSYRYEIPKPDASGINNAFVLASSKGHAEFMGALHEEVCRDNYRNLDWIARPTYQTSGSVILKFMLAAYIYYGLSQIWDETPDSAFYTNKHTNIARNFFADFITLHASFVFTSVGWNFWWKGQKSLPDKALETKHITTALNFAALNKQKKSLEWLLTKRGVISNDYLPSIDARHQSLFTSCIIPDASLENTQTLLASLEDIGKTSETKDAKILSLIGSISQPSNQHITQRLRQENLIFTKEDINRLFKKAILSKTSNSYIVFLAETLPPDLKIDKAVAEKMIRDPNIIVNSEKLRDLRIYLHPIPIKPFNQTEEISQIPLDIPEEFSSIKPPPEAPLRSILKKHFGDIDTYTDESGYIWYVENPNQIGWNMTGITEPKFWSDEIAVPSSAPTVHDCDNEDVLTFQDSSGKSKTIEYKFWMTRINENVTEIIPIRLRPSIQNTKKDS